MGDELVKEQSTEVYVIPQPQDIIAEQEAIIFIQELQKLPTAWVYVLTRVLSRKTPKMYVQSREGPLKMVLFYVDGAYAIATLAALSQLGIGHDFEILQTVTEEDGASSLGKLTFKFYHQGQILTVSATQWGDCPKRLSMSWGDCKKGSATDAQKKCLSEFGWAADIYAMAPEKAPAPPTAEEAHARSIEYVITAATEKGISPAELTEYCKKTWNKDVPDLDQATLTSLKRRINSKDGLYGKANSSS
jgi:hypothetical protein